VGGAPRIGRNRAPYGCEALNPGAVGRDGRGGLSRGQRHGRDAIEAWRGSRGVQLDRLTCPEGLGRVEGPQSIGRRWRPLPLQAQRRGARPGYLRRVAGYSGTPLPRKLGLAPGQRISLTAAPPGFARSLVPLPDGAVQVARGPVDLAVVFVRSRGALAAALPGARDRLDPDGALWVSWPKRSSGVETDLTEGVVRDLALTAGLVDVKVCAVDETWSGLKLVFRRADRDMVRAARAGPAAGPTRQPRPRSPPRRAPAGPSR
jgi:hypothetical protein